MKSKTPYLGLFIALALILSYVESLIPFSFGVPGIKLGLTNIVTVLVLYLYGVKNAAVVSLLRVFLSGFLFGNLFGILYGLAGAALSLAVMSVLKGRKSFSMPGISMAGGVSHNMGQLFIAISVVQNYNVGLYAPALLAAGLVTGFLVGLTAKGVYYRIQKIAKGKGELS